MTARLPVLILTLVTITACSANSSSHRVNGGDISFSIVDEARGVHWWHFSNKSYRVELVQPELDADPSWRLFLTEQIVRDHVSIPGTSNVKVTAYPLTETEIGEPLWTFEAEGDSWRLVDPQTIEVIRDGCCDDPGSRTYFRIRDGTAIDRAEK